MGNTQLVTYGITTEKTDYRAHVCVDAGRVYIYPTRATQAMLREYPRRFQIAPSFTMLDDGRKIKTGEGYLVPPSKLPGCWWVEIPNSWMDKIDFQRTDNATVKGEKAQTIVEGLLKTGRSRVPILPKAIDDMDQQVAGVDLRALCDERIQVKCDWTGGHRDAGGTGNLYLQVRECNPRSQR